MKKKKKVKKSTVNGDGFLSVSTSSSVSRTVPDASRLKHTVSSLCPVRPSVRRSENTNNRDGGNRKAIIFR